MKGANSFLVSKHGKTEREDIPSDWDRNEFETPDRIFQWLFKSFRFSWDMAASSRNAKRVNFFEKGSAGTDALISSWPKDGWLFINPPYNPLEPWIKMIQAQARLGCKIVALVPASVEYKRYYQTYRAQQVAKLVGRISFCIKGQPIPGNRDDSIVLVYGPVKPMTVFIDKHTLREIP